MLGPGDVHVWCARLDGSDPASARRLLVADEQARADAFYLERDRHRFIHARATLRRLLGRYLGIHPAAVRFHYGPSGKPALDGPADRSHLQFNLSHCGPLSLIALSARRAVGVDLEQVRELPDIALLESRIFSQGELNRQQSRPEEERRLEFFLRWTQREAAGKARGVGLDLDAPSTEGLASPDASSPGNSGAPSLSFIRPADPDEGYVGCVAIEGTPSGFSVFQWSDRRLDFPMVPSVPPAPQLAWASNPITSPC